MCRTWQLGPAALVDDPAVVAMQLKTTFWLEWCKRTTYEIDFET
jgi:hypothetical protein